jgi:hypothetical protein
MADDGEAAGEVLADDGEVHGYVTPGDRNRGGQGRPGWPERDRFVVWFIVAYRVITVVIMVLTAWSATLLRARSPGAQAAHGTVDARPQRWAGRGRTCG